MRVFISWSGERSRQVAELFRWWLKCVIQATDPWVSSEDIESGSVWFNEIGDQLASTTIGIICLTQENKEKPWILFETGALTKGLTKGRVCPFLIDLEAQDVKNPMSQLNLSTHDRDGVFKLVKTINNSLVSNALSQDVLSRAFETYWPQFQKRFAEIIDTTTSDTPVSKRPEDDILNEILLTVRSFDRRIGKLENANGPISPVGPTLKVRSIDLKYKIVIRFSDPLIESWPIVQVLRDQFKHIYFAPHNNAFDSETRHWSLIVEVSDQIDTPAIELLLRRMGIPYVDILVSRLS